MKSNYFSLCFLGLLVGMPTASIGENVKKPQIRDVATHDQLVSVRRKMEQADPVLKFTPVEGEDPSKVNQPGSLMSRSDVICFNGNVTLVPKRAILHIPKGLSERFEIHKDARFQTWTEFYQGNMGWITTFEVTRRQAEGRDPFDEEAIDRINKSSNLIVATFMGNPISVLPLKTSDETAKTETK